MSEWCIRIDGVIHLKKNDEESDIQSYMDNVNLYTLLLYGMRWGILQHFYTLIDSETREIRILSDSELLDAADKFNNEVNNIFITSNKKIIVSGMITESSSYMDCDRVLVYIDNEKFNYDEVLQSYLNSDDLYYEIVKEKLYVIKPCPYHALRYRLTAIGRDERGDWIVADTDGTLMLLADRLLKFAGHNVLANLFASEKARIYTYNESKPFHMYAKNLTPKINGEQFFGDLVPREIVKKKVIPFMSSKGIDNKEIYNSNLRCLTDTNYEVAPKGVIFVDPEATDSHLNIVGVPVINKCWHVGLVETLTIGPGVYTMNSEAFEDGHNIKRVNIGPDVEEIGFGMIGHAYALTNIDFSRAKRLESIGSDAFSMNRIRSGIDLSQCTQLKYIHRTAFSDAINNIILEKIILPPSIKILGSLDTTHCAFQYYKVKIFDMSQCVNLDERCYFFVHASVVHKFILPKKMRTLDARMLSEVSTIRTLVIPDEVKEIHPVHWMLHKINNIQCTKNNRALAEKIRSTWNLWQTQILEV